MLSKFKADVLKPTTGDSKDHLGGMTLPRKLES